MWLTVSVIVVPLGMMVLWLIRLTRRDSSQSRTKSTPLRGVRELARREEELKERPEGGL